MSHLIYTTAWSREKVKTEQLYQEWLNSLKDGDRVAIQRFHPANDSVLDFPYEFWEFQSATYYRSNRTVYAESDRDDKPFNPENGWMTWWVSDNWHGKVFPSRIVPLHSDLGLTQEKHVWATAPVYEPNYFDSERIVLSCSPRTKGRLNNVFPHGYERDSAEGRLFTAFTKQYCDDWQKWLNENGFEGVRFLYSEYIKR